MEALNTEETTGMKEEIWKEFPFHFKKRWECGNTKDDILLKGGAGGACNTPMTLLFKQSLFLEIELLLHLMVMEVMMRLMCCCNYFIIIELIN